MYTSLLFSMLYVLFACSVYTSHYAVSTPFDYAICSDTLPPLETAIPIEPLEKEPKTEGDWEEITWGVPDIMPCFPGCEQLEGSDHEKKACADQKLLRYIYSNLKYPKEAQDKEIEGMALVSFVINLEGKLEEIEVLRDPGGGTGAEAARIVASMNELEPWTVGKTYKGTPIPIRYNLPIRFKLN